MKLDTSSDGRRYQPDSGLAELMLKDPPANIVGIA
jgi:hypothetical protein